MFSQPARRWRTAGRIGLAKEKRKERLTPVEHARKLGSEPYARAVLDLFWDLFWPFEGNRPELYYDPRSAENFGVASLHAKCLVVDHEQTLITSANFTERGQEFFLNRL